MLRIAWKGRARSAAQSLTWDRIVVDFEHVLADVAH